MCSARHAALHIGFALALLRWRPALSSRDSSVAQSSLTPAGDGSLLPGAGGTLQSSANLQPVGPTLGQGRQVAWHVDCRSHGTFLEVLSSSSGGVRELVWGLLHRDMMEPETAMALLDLEEKRAAAEVRKEVAEWILSVRGGCASPSLCQALAKTLLATDEPACPIDSILPQAQHQLDQRWANNIADQGHAAAQSSSRQANGSNELAVRRWGVNLLQSAPGSPRAAVDEASTREASSSVQTEAQSAALEHLELLARSLAEPDADLLHLVRQFLKAAEKTQGRKRFTATGSPDNLVGLLRLLHEQRSQATVHSLVRDAVLVDFHEARVAGLEDAWARFDADCARSGGGCIRPMGQLSLPVGEDSVDSRVELAGAGAKSRLARISARAERVSALLERLSADHATVLPTDAGALPAYWTGRVERVRRGLDGYIRGGEFRPTVLIWTCSFGGGHWAAARAVQAYLPDYTTVVTDPSRDREYYEGDTVGNWIRRFIKPDWDKTYVFNQLVLRNKVYELESTFEELQAIRGWFRGDGTHFARPCPSPTCDNEDKKLMRRALLRSSPDLVVTVYHMDLLPIAELCDELGGLPIMHLSTDADVKMRQVFGARPAYSNLRVGLTFDVPEVWPTIQPLARSQTFVSGYSVRMAFLRPLPTSEERRAERLRRRLRADARVVLVMSGSEGQSVDWPTRLADSETWSGPLHVIVVAARNSEFGARLEAQLQPVPLSGSTPRLRGRNEDVTVQVARGSGGGLGRMQSVYFLSEDEVASLMDVSDVLITKPGGSTVAEAAYRGIPIVFDATGGMLSWEEFNARVFELHDRGISMTSVSDLEHCIRRASELGRSQSLVKDSLSGRAIDARWQIRQQMQSMLEAFAARRQQLQ